VTISGTVRDPAGNPVAGAQVTLYPGHYQGAPVAAEAATDQNGRYEMRLQIDPREFTGEIIPTNSLLARDPKRNLAAILDFSGTPANLDLNLQPGLRLSGSVTDTNGAPMNNVVVDLYFESGRQSRKLSPRPEKTDAAGSFSIPALPQGREYFLPWGITAPGCGWLYGRLEAKDTLTNHYEFPAFVLKLADRKLAGQVFGPFGKPVAGATVSFSGPGQPRLGETPAMPSATKTDAQGRFSFDAVCEGQVTVTAVMYENTRGKAAAWGGDTNVVVSLGGP
jgi:5-hydroxyisourate hydrolase-like protein (transthyretin family)